MNIKSTFNKINRIVFIICTTMSIMTILTNYNLYINYIFYFWLTYLSSYLFICFTSNKKSIYITTLGLIIISYNFFNEFEMTEIRMDIKNSDYKIVENRNNYKVIKEIFILDKIIAHKKSHIFLSNRTKTGIVHPFLVEVKMLKESETNITLKIIVNHKQTIDTIRKNK